MGAIIILGSIINTQLAANDCRLKGNKVDDWIAVIIGLVLIVAVCVLLGLIIFYG